MCKGEESGEGVDVTLVSNSLRYISLTDLPRDWGLITNGPVWMTLLSYTRRYISLVTDAVRVWWVLG